MSDRERDLIPDDTISVSAKPLREVLVALNGSPHLLREMQATRGVSALLGEKNAIQQLTEEFNAGGLSQEPGFHLSRNNSVAVADALTYLPMETCPIGVKVLLLNRGGVAVLGVVRKGELDEWRGWFPLPKERKK